MQNNIKVRYILSPAIILLFVASLSFAQETTSYTEKNNLSLEAVVGTDLVYCGYLGGLVKYNIYNNIAVATQTNLSRSYESMGEIVSISPENFRSINFTFSQRFGAGAVIGKERFHHTLLLMAGPKYYYLKETHSYPQFEKASATVSTWIPDAGFMYGLKIGKQSTYFATQLYIPFLMIPDNLMAVTFSVGIGLQ